MTSTQNTDNLVSWLNTNSFWDAQNLQLKQSKLGGIGVFATIDLDPSDQDQQLLLRIPKKNILSGKTSCISNLLYDYKIHGVHGLILSYIYEESLGESSPWYHYIESINIRDEYGNLTKPICKWDQDELDLLFNTDCDISNMLDGTELDDFYSDAISFADEISDIFPIPSILDQDKAEPNFERFSAIVQAISSRSFEIDAYHEIALVPGADLFNHNIKENIHFTCLGEVCDRCGDVECEHQEMEHDSDIEIDSDDDKLLDGIYSDSESDMDLLEFDDDGKPLKHSNDESEDEIEIDDINEGDMDDRSGDEEEPVEGLKEITMDYIVQLEKDIEAERLAEEDTETESEVGSGDEEEQEEGEGEDEEEQDEQNTNLVDFNNLTPELDDMMLALNPDECCDILLMHPVKANEEIFNTYGDLSNPYLLQRYGFIIPENKNDYISLSLGMLRSTNIDHSRLEWWDKMGYETICDVIRINDSKKAPAHDHDKEHDHDHTEEGCCDDDDGCEDGCCGDDEEDDNEPESWELSPRLDYNGVPTQQTIALARLLILPAKQYTKLTEVKRSKLESAIQVLLQEDKESFKLIKSWIQQRLSRYNDKGASKASSFESKIQTAEGRKKAIYGLIQSERIILAKGMLFIDKK